MTVKARTIYTKSVMLSPALYARWEAYHAQEGLSFNGIILSFLERTLPHLEASGQAGAPSRPAAPPARVAR